MGPTVFKFCLRASPAARLPLEIYLSFLCPSSLPPLTLFPADWSQYHSLSLSASCRSRARDSPRGIDRYRDCTAHSNTNTRLKSRSSASFSARTTPSCCFSFWRLHHPCQWAKNPRCLRRRRRGDPRSWKPRGHPNHRGSNDGRILRSHFVLHRFLGRRASTLYNRQCASLERVRKRVFSWIRFRSYGRRTKDCTPVFL